MINVIVDRPRGIKNKYVCVRVRVRVCKESERDKGKMERKKRKKLERPPHPHPLHHSSNFSRESSLINRFSAYIYTNFYRD